MSATVSIVVPVYNQERHLMNTIPSILCQKYKELEIILVNDGSTDCSREILEGFKESDSRIIIIDKENGGLVSAIVAGVMEASGEYICFMDSDDHIGEDYVSSFMNHIEACDFVAMGFYFEKEGHVYTQRLFSDKEYGEHELKLLTRNSHAIRTIRGKEPLFFVSRWNKLYRADFLKKVIQKYQICMGISNGEDTIFTYYLLANAKKAKVISAPNEYYYNVGSFTSMTYQSAMSKHINAAQKALKTYRSILEEDSEPTRCAYTMYFYLIESLFQRVQLGSDEEFSKLYKLLKSDSDYQKGLDAVIQESAGSTRLKYIIRKIVKSPKIFLIIKQMGKKQSQLNKLVKK